MILISFKDLYEIHIFPEFHRCGSKIVPATPFWNLNFKWAWQAQFLSHSQQGLQNCFFLQTKKWCQCHFLKLMMEFKIKILALTVISTFWVFPAVVHTEINKFYCMSVNNSIHQVSWTLICSNNELKIKNIISHIHKNYFSIIVRISSRNPSLAMSASDLATELNLISIFLRKSSSIIWTSGFKNDHSLSNLVVKGLLIM